MIGPDNQELCKLLLHTPALMGKHLAFAMFLVIELKEVDEETSMSTDSLESTKKAQVKGALDDLQRSLG